MRESEEGEMIRATWAIVRTGLFLYAGVLLSLTWIRLLTSGEGLGGAILGVFAFLAALVLSLGVSVALSISAGFQQKHMAEKSGLSYTSLASWCLKQTALGIVIYVLLYFSLNFFLPVSVIEIGRMVLNPVLFVVIFGSIFLPGAMVSNHNTRGWRLSTFQWLIGVVTGFVALFLVYQSFQPRPWNIPVAAAPLRLYPLTQLDWPIELGSPGYATLAPGSYDRVVAYYRTAMSQNGWSIIDSYDFGSEADTHYGARSMKLVASNGTQTFHVMIYPSQMLGFVPAARVDISTN